MILSRKNTVPKNSLPQLFVLAKRKYEKNYIKKVKTDSGEVRIYDDAHVKKRWKRKVEHINSLKRNLPKLQKKYREDLKSDDPKQRALATAVAVLDMTAMRVGNDGSVDEFGTFGATTLKKKHVKVSGSKVTFKFLGKKQVDQQFSLSDAVVARSIKELLAGKTGNDFLFEYDDGKRIRAKVVNRYLADFDITAKDLRGFHANRLMREELKSTKDFDKALEVVSDEVGHEPKTLMNQYLDPALVNKYKKASDEGFSLADYVNSELSKILGTSQSTSRVPVSAPIPKKDDGKASGGELAGRQKINSPFGMRTHPITGEKKFHGGVDMPAPEGAKVYAFANGNVISTDSTDYGGNTIVIRHGSDGSVETQYLHLSKILVSEGQHVRGGQLIGLVGKTGRVTGPHLHFILKQHAEAINPAEYLTDRIILGV